MTPAFIPTGVHEHKVTRWRNFRSLERVDCLADEVPVALVLNGISHTVMMATPADLEDFALGFGLTEGLLVKPSELYGVEVHSAADGIELHLEVSAACAWRLKERRRTLAGRTGCGICGVDSLSQVRRAPKPVCLTQVSAAAIGRANTKLRDFQVRQQLTGSTHAAAWCSLEGEVRYLREDVGRHNALDKVVGAMIRSCADPADGFVCITSRASFEMVQKTAMAGIATLAAVSAPTCLAVQTAHEWGVALAGFVRGDDFVAYTFPNRLGLSGASDQNSPE